MRILAITSHFPPYHIGGFEIRCKNVLDQLSIRGHEIKIIVSKTPRRIGEAPIEERNIYRQFHLLDSSKNSIERAVRDYVDLKFLHQVLNSFKPDLIYLWQVNNVTKTIFPYLAECSLPIVYDEGGASLIDSWMHGGSWYAYIERKSKSWLKNKLKAIIRNLVSKISGDLIKKQWSWPQNMHIYFNSETGKSNALMGEIPVNGAPVIHSGVDIKRFSFRARDEINFRIRIIVPGRIEPKKGQRDSILLLQHLLEKNLDVILTIVGMINSVPYYQEIIGTIEELDLEKQTEVLPMVDQDELARLYQGADICFFPSYANTGLSRIPLEAFACGCLVITYGNEGSNEIITQGETGYIVPPGDFDTMVAITQQVISDTEKYQQIIHNARRFVERNHSMDAYVDQIEAFLLDSIR